MNWTAVAEARATCDVPLAAVPAAPPPAARAKSGGTDTRGEGVEQTVRCDEATVLVNSTRDVDTARGICCAVTVMGSSDTGIAATVRHDITMNGSDETVFPHTGTPSAWPRSERNGAW